MVKSLFGRESREDNSIKKRLTVIQILIFILPFLIVFYLFYEKQWLFRSSDLTLITLIFILVLGGLVLLREIFDRILAIADSLKRAETGEVVPIHFQEGPSELEGISSSLNKIMDRLEKTTENLDQKVLELVAIKELYEVARKSIDMDALLNIALEKAMAVTGSKIGSLVVLEEGTRQYRIALRKGLDGNVHEDCYINMEESFLKNVIAEKRAIIVRNIEEDPRTSRPNDPRYGSPSFMSMPILIENNVAAMLNLAKKVTGEVFTENDEQIMSIMLNEISFALENAHLHAQIKDHLKEIQEHSRHLEQEIAERRLVEEKLRRSQDDLETTVEKRTAELLRANEALRVEIAERRRAEEILRESEEKYRLHFSNVSDAIYSVSPDLVFVNVSPSALNLLGYKPEELIGKSLMECNFFVPESREKAISDIMQIMGGERLSPAIYELLAKDGSRKIVEVSGTPLIREEKVVAVISVARDITERKRLESELLQARKMEAIGTLAGGIAHDFNNVLTGIQGYTSLMLFDMEANHPHYESLKCIEENVRSGSDLTKQLLGFARGDKFEVKPTNLNEVTQKISHMFSRTRKDIVFHESYPDDLWTVEADRGQIEQVLLNLFVNAAQAMPDGGQIHIATGNTTVEGKEARSNYVTPGDYVTLTVTDTGVGMDEQTRERIFEPFFTTKEMGRGTGLGLSSVYGIVKGHGGFINVFSEKGKGTTFHIHLPVTERKANRSATIAEELYRGSGTILLVDDEESIRKVCRDILEMLGYRVLVAGNGDEALEQYQANRNEIDLVLMDMIMPGLGGGDVFDLLKAINPNIKVILTTGYSVNGSVPSLLERGCKGYIQKPFKL
ncbi:MAG: PAS domain S-box protein, partial [Deltaproteobacteria bacterium]|nr:PAS domain S-box protein [Deltaproteobacteria bacterium]